MKLLHIAALSVVFILALPLALARVLWDASDAIADVAARWLEPK